MNRLQISLFDGHLYSVKRLFGRDFIHPITCDMLRWGVIKFTGSWI